MSRKFEDDSDTGVATETKKKAKLQKPRLYKVLLHNDNYTTRDFVVAVLREVFHKSETDAIQIMLHVHTRGIGVCGVFTRDVAETKVHQVNNYSRENQHPLLCTMEKA